MSVGATGHLQRAFLAVEGMDPARDRESAWRAYDALGDEVFFGGGTVNSAVLRVFHTEQSRRRPRRDKR